MLALSRGETISAGWLVVAGVCTYLVAYRFYSRYLAYTVFGLTIAALLRPSASTTDAISVRRTNGWRRPPFFSHIRRGAARRPDARRAVRVSPGTIWLIAGVVLGGAVQDMIVLCASVRRDGKSLGQMARRK